MYLFRVHITASLLGIPYLAGLRPEELGVVGQLGRGTGARRREYQGLPVREGEVEQMQALIPELTMAAGVALIFAVLCVTRKLSRRAQRDAAAARP